MSRTPDTRPIFITFSSRYWRSLLFNDIVIVKKNDFLISNDFTEAEREGQKSFAKAETGIQEPENPLRNPGRQNPHRQKNPFTVRAHHKIFYPEKTFQSSHKNPSPRQSAPTFEQNHPTFA